MPHMCNIYEQNKICTYRFVLNVLRLPFNIQHYSLCKNINYLNVYTVLYAGNDMAISLLFGIRAFKKHLIFYRYCFSTYLLELSVA